MKLSNSIYCDDCDYFTFVGNDIAYFGEYRCDKCQRLILVATAHRQTIERLTLILDDLSKWIDTGLEVSNQLLGALADSDVEREQWYNGKIMALLDMEQQMIPYHILIDAESEAE